MSVIVQLKENFKALLLLKNDCQEIFDQYQASILFPTSYNSNTVIVGFAFEVVNFLFFGQKLKIPLKWYFDSSILKKFFLYMT